jgi:hypothetical protein
MNTPVISCKGKACLFDLAQLLKLQANLPKVEDLKICGHVDQYDESYDKKAQALINFISSMNLPYNKIVAWCKNIDECNNIYSYLKTNSNYTILNLNSKSDISSDFAIKELNMKNNIILLCVDMCREGTNIPTLDCGAFLESYISKSIIVRLQTSGRINRIDDDRKKQNAVIFELVNKKSIKVEDKIISDIISLYLMTLGYNEEDELVDELVFENDDNKKKIHEEIIGLIKTCEKKDNNLIVKIDKKPNHDLIFNGESIKLMDIENVRNNMIKQIDYKFGYINNELEQKLKEVMKYDYTKSKVLDCKINNKSVKINTWSCCLDETYKILKTYDNIIKNTTFQNAITNTKKTDKGFKYKPSLGISRQGQDANSCMKELYTQSYTNKINLEIKVQLYNNTIVTIQL